MRDALGFFTIPPLVLSLPTAQLVHALAGLPLLVCAVTYTSILFFSKIHEDESVSCDVVMCLRINERLSSGTVRFWIGVLKIVELVGVAVMLSHLKSSSYHPSLLHHPRLV